MKAKHKRLLVILVCLSIGGLTAAMILQNFRSNLVFFYAPTELIAEQKQGMLVRLGGLVTDGSVRYEDDGAVLLFDITDGNETITIRYRGLPPALFREGQGMVARGTLNEAGIFEANQLLAKHDETYMPPEVARALKESGHWKEDEKK